VEGLFVRCRGARVDDSTVRRAVRVAKLQIAGGVSFDHELATVQGAVMRSTNRDEVVRAVLAAFRAKRNMVQVEKKALPATWNDASSTIASDHMAPHGRRDVLSSFRQVCPHVGVADTLRVTFAPLRRSRTPPR